MGNHFLVFTFPQKVMAVKINNNNKKKKWMSPDRLHSNDLTFKNKNSLNFKECMLLFSFY